jgi:hypothetical protein
MPIDYQQIFQKIQNIGQGAAERRKTLEERRKQARDLLSNYASQLDVLRSKVDSAKATDSNLRCAGPFNEPLASSYPPPAEASEATLVAVDGSQIIPDRHIATQFGLINVGAIIMKLNSGEAPTIITESELLFGDDLISNNNPISEGMIALRRDIGERTKLDELTKEIKGPVVSLTDGPLELWGAKEVDPQAYNEFIERYKVLLSRLQSRGVVNAGYVDKPAANLVVRLLEIASAPDDQLKKLREFHPLRGVSDRWLFGEPGNPLLPPGHRSAVFVLQSGSEKKYTGVLSLHFFYLNVGSEGHPCPVRVEIPRWVADDKKCLDLLHAILIQQCNMMGSRPYPYLLHRAHETAVVKQEEKEQVEHLLMMEMRKYDEEMDHGSNKQSAKDLPGRTRR